MSLRIEDYALIGDCQSAALVGRDGSIDWLCLPRFDSGACFAALLGGRDRGRWLIAPSVPIRAVRRRYLEGTLILETEFETDEGVVAVIDFMPPRTNVADVIRIVEGRSGRVPMRTELVIRFDYGSIVPWVTSDANALYAIAGPERLRLRTPVAMHGQELSSVGEVVVAAGQRVPFDLTWYPSHEPQPPALDVEDALASTKHFWRSWSDRYEGGGRYRDAVLRSLITLKALTYAPTGGLVAAPTTSLPEVIGGERNWDYRYCWIRDATFTLYAFLSSGYVEEARAFREWLVRAVAGTPSQVQIMYGLGGERRLTELELPWLDGYEGSRPVRIGNGAYSQLQLDVYGEILDAAHQSRRAGMDHSERGWELQKSLLHALESGWKEPDEGIWEVRGPRRHFTHSKVMSWVAFDRAVKAVERFGMEGPVERWRALRDAVHAEVCTAGFNQTIGAFVQSYGSDRLDASLLMIPLVGFLPASDHRVRSTVGAIERGLMHNGFVRRYATDPAVDGLHGEEGAFLACTFWLADNYAMLGRGEDAKELFERLLAIRNDVGLLAEEYDSVNGRQVGNFPQAFSHIGLINTARNIELHARAACDRADAAPPSTE
jgi:GH15 family glucan-1,4-alpha-glucosidase